MLRPADADAKFVPQPVDIVVADKDAPLLQVLLDLQRLPLDYPAQQEATPGGDGVKNPLHLQLLEEALPLSEYCSDLALQVVHIRQRLPDRDLGSDGNIIGQLHSVDDFVDLG
ncbi:MAG: hypothetical protein DDT28_00909 [Dehalococcoidia bacterium]|nr:hypothetical protein [Chloroflexota bacterium]